MTAYRSFDRVADVYDETRGVPPDVEAQIADGLAGVLREAAASPRLLEIGIGTGRMAVPLAARGVRVAGIDISRKMLGVLRSKRTDIDVMLAESTRLPLQPRSFDAALFVHILHLVPDAEATVRAALPLIRSGGVIISGGDDREQGLRAEADALIRGVVQDVAGAKIPDWKNYEGAVQAFERVVSEAGATLERRTLASWTSTSSARRMIERLARRDYSSSWLIPDEALPEVVERSAVLLEKLYGSPDGEVPYERSFSIVAARLPE